MPTLEDVKTWSGQEAVDPNGDKIGSLDHIYLDRQTGEPTFLAVKTGLLGHNLSLVPVEGARTHEGHVHLAFDKAKVKDAPNVEADGELSEAEEAELYGYYGIAGYSQYEGPDHDTLAEHDRPREPVGRDTSGPTTDEAMTRSEEQLRVGTRSEEVGKARLRKYIVTENVTTTVPVQREEVRIEREPITDANVGDALDGPALTEEEHEVTLRAETPVVEKDVVAKERVRLDKDTVTEDVHVDESVRKEQIDTDSDVGTDRRI
ncbi:MAG: YsnF/AvaK domain-containing protein [Actinomycetota bacterium]|nr:YsnF/AvaK domain-containing protein [Actinomycetota bacterium]